MRWWVSKSGVRCFASGFGERLVCRAASSCRGSDGLVERLRISAASSSTLRAPRVSVSLPGCSPKKSIVVKIVERKPMPYAVLAGVGGTKAIRTASPASARLRVDFQWTELVERDRRAVACPLVHVATDHFLLEASFGSLHSFQVLVQRRHGPRKFSSHELVRSTVHLRW